MNRLIREGYIGHPDQADLLRRVVLREGKARGSEIIEVCTAEGLHLDILPDRGLDIGQARYRGYPMSWISKNGDVSAAACLPYENEFLNTFPGGLVYTCGTRNAGPANRDDGEWHPLHGRHHALGAEEVCASRDDGGILVTGVIRETALFGHVLETRRRIRVSGTTVTVEDTLANLTPRKEEYMRIFHCNFGYPLLSEKARLILPEERETIPRTGFAEAGMDRACDFEPPVPGEEERVFFQKMKQEFRAELVSPEIGVRMTMTWSGDTLPILSEWRSMAAGDYVLGLEPCNCYIMGRNRERENGTLPVLGPFEEVRHRVTIEFTEEKDHE